MEAFTIEGKTKQKEPSMAEKRITSVEEGSTPKESSPNKKKSAKKKKVSLVLEFTGETLPLFDWLEMKAKDNFRTPENELMFVLKLRKIYEEKKEIQNNGETLPGL